MRKKKMRNLSMDFSRMAVEFRRKMNLSAKKYVDPSLMKRVNILGDQGVGLTEWAVRWEIKRKLESKPMLTRPEW